MANSRRIPVSPALLPNLPAGHDLKKSDAFILSFEVHEILAFL